MNYATTLLFLWILPLAYSPAQNVGVNDDGSSPNASAILDVKSNSKGILIPRLSSSQRQAIASPATSLLVYDTNTNSFWFYNSTNWNELTESFHGFRDADNDTKIQVEEATDEDIIRFDLAGTEHFVMDGPRLKVLSSGGSIFIGNGAGLNDDLNGHNNVLIGSQAGQANVSAHSNTAVGTNALQDNTSGNLNTAIGINSLNSNISGTTNTAIGERALFNNTTGISNTSIGAATMHNNISGDQNVAIGDQTLYTNSTGHRNVALGTSALAGNFTGSQNTGVGLSAGLRSQTNSNCTFLGAYADNFSSAPYSNSMGLGYQASLTDNNQIRIGNSAITSIGGYTNWTNLSDARFKKNIAEDVMGLNFILALRPITYQLDLELLVEKLNENRNSSNSDESTSDLKIPEGEKKSNIRYSGLLAQEVEATAQKVGYNFSGVDKPNNEDSFYGLRYAEFTVPLIKAVQELASKVKRLENELEVLRKTK